MIASTSLSIIPDSLAKEPVVIVIDDVVFYSFEKLGHLRDVISELTRHLNVLNDCGVKLHSYYAGNESKLFQALKSSHNVECSGKGSKDSQRYDKIMLYDGVMYNLTCNHIRNFLVREQIV